MLATDLSESARKTQPQPRRVKQKVTKQRTICASCTRWREKVLGGRYWNTKCWQKWATETLRKRHLVQSWLGEFPEALKKPPTTSWLESTSWDKRNCTHTKLVILPAKQGVARPSLQWTVCGSSATMGAKNQKKSCFENWNCYKIRAGWTAGTRKKT